ncbi:MAG: hypothetical protein CMO80_00740 [Verrucomicrobiales bacterium]|nr:hypothetical protein [Verrucomicrobiales bacterium]
MNPSDESDFDETMATPASGETRRPSAITIMLGIVGMMYTFLFGLLHLLGEQERLNKMIYQGKRVESGFRAARWYILNRMQRPQRPPTPEGWINFWQDFVYSPTDNGSKLWIVNKRAMVSNLGKGSVPPLPITEPHSPWIVRMTVRKLFNAGPIAFLIPVESAWGTFLFDAHRQGNRFAGMELVDGATENSSVTRKSFLPGNGRMHQFEISYTPLENGEANICANLEDETLVNWTGDPTPMTHNPNWEPEDPARVHLASTSGNWVIESLLIKPN